MALTQFVLTMCLLILMSCLLSGCLWQVIDQSELQINFTSDPLILSSSPLWAEFEQLQNDSPESGFSSSKASSVCANGICTIY